MTAQVLHSAISAIVAAWLLIWIGNWLCKLILDASGLSRARDARAKAAAEQEAETAIREGRNPPEAAVESPNVGKVIGAIERAMIAAGVIFSAWQVMAAVVALKSVARFKELDHKLDAEYFLVGSLFSLGWAGLIGKLWVLYDHCFGLDVAVRLAGWGG